MANITIVKLKVRRGSDNQRKQITLDQGEVGYTLDTRRLFVGDGTTLGGRVIGNTSIGPFSDITNLGPANSPGLQVGDIGYANSKLYRLTSFNYDDALSGYAYIGNLPDNSTLEFGTEPASGTNPGNENKLIVKKNPGALNASHFAGNFFGDGLLSAGEILQPSLDPRYLFLSGDVSQTKVIAPTVGSITHREIFRESIGLGLSGGNRNDQVNNEGTRLSVDINRDQFEFEPSSQPGGGRIKLKSIGFGTAIPVSAWAGGFGSPSNLNGGLTVNSDNTIEANVQGVAGAGLQLVDNNITLDFNQSISSPDPDGSGSELNYPTVVNGLVTELNTSIYDIVTAIGLSGANTGDNVPIGAIIPHSRAFTGTLPTGYLLCNGGSYSQASYAQLYDVIGNNYGDGNDPGNTFNVPALTGGGMPGFLYGAGAIGPETGSIWVSGGSANAGDNNQTANTAVSGLGINYIIKYREDPLRSIFNGSPDQVSQGLVGAQNNQIYECITSTGGNVQLSSGGFIRFALSGSTRADDDGVYNKFAIPVFNYE